MTKQKRKEPPASGREAATAEQGKKERIVTAYLLWLLLGVFGAHRFYLGRWKTGMAMTFGGMVVWTAAVVFSLLSISPFYVVSPMLVWWLLDGYLLSRWLNGSE
ncbi:TM2 domain-containing protein [Desmospora activa]|uniref:TM2 domain-containing protein n=1 Tax=Desmospora activa DSM 45169 TaxID=1121389 RepID=A0A2T4Z3P1_9BACL|nr:TM2 domain-containing protein [Desmospora activa]PTM56504.1 TM2 domain-containing protein [Desmospora activa DSM 45169]